MTQRSSAHTCTPPRPSSEAVADLGEGSLKLLLLLLEEEEDAEDAAEEDAARPLPRPPPAAPLSSRWHSLKVFTLWMVQAAP